MRRNPIRLLNFTAMAGVAFAVCAATAIAEGANIAPEMPISHRTVPPMGYLNFCERMPQECAVPQGAQMAERVRAREVALFWNKTFSTRGAPSVQAHASPVSVTGMRSAPGGFDWSGVFAPVDAARPVSVRVVAGSVPASTVLSLAKGTQPSSEGVTAWAAQDVADQEKVSADKAPVIAHALYMSHAILTKDAPKQAAQSVMSAREFGRDVSANGQSSQSEVRSAVGQRAATIRMDVLRWQQIEQLNRKVNRTIRQVSDLQQYGVADYWALASSDGPGIGDCEDYVLTKRRALIDVGYPESALSIALVETSWGEEHAVLLFATSEGEFVLDSLTPRILRWDRAGYKWKERQIAGSSFEWAKIGM